MKDRIENDCLVLSEALKKLRCSYRQDLELLCFEDCGKGNAIDCPIWMRESGRLAEALNQRE